MMFCTLCLKKIHLLFSFDGGTCSSDKVPIKDSNCGFKLLLFAENNSKISIECNYLEDARLQ